MKHHEHKAVFQIDNLNNLFVFYCFFLILLFLVRFVLEDNKDKLFYFRISFHIFTFAGSLNFVTNLPVFFCRLYTNFVYRDQKKFNQIIIAIINIIWIVWTIHINYVCVCMRYNWRIISNEKIRWFKQWLYC